MKCFNICKYVLALPDRLPARSAPYRKIRLLLRFRYAFEKPLKDVLNAFKRPSKRL